MLYRRTQIGWLVLVPLGVGGLLALASLAAAGLFAGAAITFAVLAILAAISFMAIWSFRATLTLIAEADARRNKAEEAASAKPPDKGRGGQIRPRE